MSCYSKFLLDVKQFDEACHGEDFLKLTTNMGKHDVATLGSTLLLQFQQTAKA